ncbi:MAG: hypothetical protein C4560_04910 [Nitrospiraceae bacterium]|nr:MAG: hypothetical protein C4560_04910 [Nitrospiraceae bacterium]
MKMTLVNKVAVLVLFVSIFLLSNIAVADTLYFPWLDFAGSFSYTNGNCGNASKCKLTFSNWNITGGQYLDGSYFGEGSDPVTGATFSIGTLYNQKSPANLTFDGTYSASTTSPVSFTISNGGITYLTAQLNNFVITDSLFGTQLNPLYDHTKSNLTNITFNANGSAYITQLETSYNTHGYINLGMDFSFNSGSSGSGTAFTDNAAGSVSGKMVVTPEPVSIILFIAGGATLAARRFWKIRDTNSEQI